MIALAALLATGAVLANQPEPIFGPQTFERTTGETNTYTEPFDSPLEGDFVLYLLNGDEEGNRVASGTVEINGAAIVQTSDLNENVPVLRRPVTLQLGSNELVVELQGPPGSFVTLVIFPPGQVPRFVHGRLVLPWGRNDAERGLGLALKNGSPRARRAVRIVFFTPAGEVAAVSERIVLSPRASLAAAVDDLVAAGEWEVGSVEIYYAGPGTARLFGTARHWSIPLGDTEFQSLINAGFRVYRHRPDNPHRELRP
jgi:hypothetical protein